MLSDYNCNNEIIVANHVSACIKIMKYLLLYFTGTFNTRYLTSLLKNRLEQRGNEVSTYEIDPLHTEVLDFTEFDWVGLGYPIYGFNAPWSFLKFIKAQNFPKGLKTFIYKNSGETYHANDASSVSVVRKLKKDGATVLNEYHFIMPYNIHFRFDDKLIREMLEVDDQLLDILCYELSHKISNIKPYRLVHRIITFFVKLQFIGGDVNSFFYKVDKDKCIGCGLCEKNCPMHNIHKSKNGDVCFGHHCLMCMRCSMFCPKDAIHIGLFDDWRVNGAYDFEKIRQLEKKGDMINKDTKGFFKCYVETYNYIKSRYKELFS